MWFVRSHQGARKLWCKRGEVRSSEPIEQLIPVSEDRWIHCEIGISGVREVRLQFFEAEVAKKRVCKSRHFGTSGIGGWNTKWLVSRVAKLRHSEVSISEEESQRGWYIGSRRLGSILSIRELAETRSSDPPSEEKGDCVEWAVGVDIPKGE